MEAGALVLFIWRRAATDDTLAAQSAGLGDATLHRGLQREMWRYRASGHELFADTAGGVAFAFDGLRAVGRDWLLVAAMAPEKSSAAGARRRRQRG